MGMKCDMVWLRPVPLGGAPSAYCGSGMSRSLRSSSRITVYFGAREVSVPWTTSARHSRPQRAFQEGTVPHSEQRAVARHRECGLTARLDAAVLRDGLVRVAGELGVDEGHRECGQSAGGEGLCARR